MTKFLFFFLILFTWCGLFSAAARDQQDTSVVIRKDTTTINEPGPASGTEVSYDSVDQPVPDTLFSPSGPLREVSKIQVNRYKNNPEYAYANDSEYWRKEAPGEPGLLFRILSSRTLRWIFLTLIGGLILYGVYQLAREINFTLLIRTRRQKAQSTQQDSSEEKTDFDEMIRLSETEGNYRMAIRFLYLRLIYVLHEKTGISFRDSTTNSEISRAMGNHPGVAAFKWLATAYEYVFYGGFVPNQETYLHIKNKFETLQKTFSD